MSVCVGYDFNTDESAASSVTIVLFLKHKRIETISINTACKQDEDEWERAFIRSVQQVLIIQRQGQMFHISRPLRCKAGDTVGRT